MTLNTGSACVECIGGGNCHKVWCLTCHHVQMTQLVAVKMQAVPWVKTNPGITNARFVAEQGIVRKVLEDTYQ